MSGVDHIEDLGMVPVGFVDGEYVVELELEERHLNIGGIAHGGIYCSLLDTAMARSFIKSVSDEGLPAVTLEMKVNFLGAASEGTLKALGRVVARTRRTVLVEGRVEDGKGRMLARGSATMMVTDGSG
ncbi:MAG: hotdog fold thioesterase [Candidatus Eisenbacteria bacterium]|nr:hotdog fold thioesterase [Candidatus Eisenbacteria bacterium]